MAKRSGIKESDEDAGSSRGPDRPRAPGLKGQWRALKTWWRDARRWGLPLLLGGSLVLFVLGVCAVWFQGAFGSGLEDFFTGMDGFASYFFLLGFIAFAAAAYYAFGYLAKIREFERLVGTKSKSDFIRSQDKIERLAFELGRREQDQVAARKREFRIRH